MKRLSFSTLTVISLSLLVGCSDSAQQVDNDSAGPYAGAGGQIASGGSLGGVPSGGSAGAQDVSAGGRAGEAVGGNPAEVGGGSGGGGSNNAGGASAEQSEGCGKERTLQNGRITIQSGGMERSYILRVPDDYDSTHPYRLVLGYHWRGGDADQVATAPQGSATEKPYYGLWELANDGANNTTIFIAPEGIDNGWANPGGRDVTFTDDLLAQVEAELCIDTTRIFSTGFSWGAGMSYALACARPDVVRAVLLYSGAQISGCEGGAPDQPVAYFASHGTMDDVLRLNQGEGLRENFLQVNGCTPQQVPEPPSGGHVCTSYEGCADDYPARWCEFDGGHWPSQHDNGQPESWIPAEAWEFIERF